MGDNSLIRIAVIVSGIAFMASHVRAHEIHAKPPCDIFNNQYDEFLKLSHGDTSEIGDVHGLRFYDFKGEDAKSVLDAINAIPPQTSVKSDHVLVIELTGKRGIIIDLDIKGCSSHGTLSSEQWDSVQEKAFGLKM